MAKDHPDRPVRARIAAEFVQADVEIAFNLLALARQESNSGNASFVARILADVDGVLSDLDQRLAQLSDSRRASFASLVGELRREVELAKTRKA